MPSPHAAPALFTRICNAFSFDDNSLTMRCTSESLDMSPGIAMHFPGPAVLSSLAVSSHSLADRDEM